ERFVRAQEYREKIRTAGGADRVAPRDLELEALAEVLDGRRVVHFHTHRADDILTALRLSREFGFRIVLQHVSEAYRVADEIARSGASASIIILDSPGGKLEALNFSNENGRALEQAGVLTAFHTDDGITDSRFFLRSAGFGVRAGMSRERALEAMTIAGARMMGVDNRVGSLERGKDADFIVLSGDPLSVYTHVEQTWVEGSKVFDRADANDRMFAVGGPDVFDGAASHTHDGEEGH
ncbi:MAG TPA: amidohydrolase family protein, partial [Longimicrobium sp.]|nr:amidohydrolase family protein [Longimicrobium sp.]